MTISATSPRLRTKTIGIESLSMEQSLPQILEECNIFGNPKKPDDRKSNKVIGMRWIYSFRYIVYALIFLAFLMILDSAFTTWDTTCPIDKLEYTVQQLQNPDFNENKAYLFTRPRKILVVGMAAKLEDVFQRRDVAAGKNHVFDTLKQLCSSVKTDLGDYIEINILFHQNNSSEYNNEGPNHYQSIILNEWTDAGCYVVLISQDTLIQKSSLKAESIVEMSRFQRLAKLRSLHRSWILQRQQKERNVFNAVLNIDFDVLRLPRLSVINGAIDHVLSEAGKGNMQHGKILCANGFEVWDFPIMSFFKWKRPHVFYDTFAAIDAKGKWYYPSYSCDLLYIISLSQWTLFQKILFSPLCNGEIHKKTILKATTSSLWPMQTCFGGAALYDWNSWSFLECDYDAIQITLKESVPNSDNIATWKLSPKYTLTGTTDGDTCEHIVFQQCLQRANSIFEDGGEPLLPPIDVAIMSDFVVEREASLLPTKAAKARTLNVLLAALVCALSLYCLLLYFIRNHREGQKVHATSIRHLDTLTELTHPH